jgi:small-conductance mechanosensitive channel
VHLKARFTTEPRAQWKVGREFNRRLKNAFDAACIVTPVKTVTLQRPPHEPDGPDVEEPRSFQSDARPQS